VHGAVAADDDETCRAARDCLGCELGEPARSVGDERVAFEPS
jgi:hypothetical protein